MVVALLLLLLLLQTFRASCLPAGRPNGTDIDPSCSNRWNVEACQCDMPCAQYGDCCLDAPWFVSEQQRLGASVFSCESFSDTDVYMMSSCPPDWEDEYSRYRCEHPDTTYSDPLFDVPVTSQLTNITYRNRHCAFCHQDLDADSANFWPLYFSCENGWLNVDNHTGINYLVYNTTTSSWTLNVTENPEYLIFKDVTSSGYVYSCRVWVAAAEALRPVLRACDSSIVDTCPEDWTDEEVRTHCEAYTAHMCLNGTVYRNHYCGVCNNNGSFDGSICSEFSTRIFTTLPPPDFTMLLDWHSLEDRDVCQREVEMYDPFTRTCRTVYQYTAPENYISASVNETSVSILGNCSKIHLEHNEYYVEDNDTKTVFIPAHNRTLQPHEYIIGKESQLIICLPEFDEEDEEEFSPVLGYITMVGLSLSIFFLILHLFVFGVTPKLRNLSSMNLACLSVSLLIMYCAFFGAAYLRKTGIPCFLIAVIIHYSLLASFCWMLTIAYDIYRVLQQTTTQLRVLTGRHWHRFGIYCLCSWMVPAVIVGVALAAEFSADTMFENLQPGYGVRECWFNSGIALLAFIVGPLSIVMILNMVLFFRSAYLICTTTTEMQNASSTHRDFRLFGRLALIMGLSWVIGLIASFVEDSVMWYVFVLINSLQGVFIFLAFTCTPKVRQELQRYKQKRAHIPSPPTTCT